jgi:hypothetical protein
MKFKLKIYFLLLCKFYPLIFKYYLSIKFFLFNFYMIFSIFLNVILVQFKKKNRI